MRASRGWPSVSVTTIRRVAASGSSSLSTTPLPPDRTKRGSSPLRCSPMRSGYAKAANSAGSCGVEFLDLADLARRLASSRVVCSAVRLTPKGRRSVNALRSVSASMRRVRSTGAPRVSGSRAASKAAMEAACGPAVASMWARRGCRGSLVRDLPWAVMRLSLSSAPSMCSTDWASEKLPGLGCVSSARSEGDAPHRASSSARPVRSAASISAGGKGRSAPSSPLVQRR